MVMSMRLYLAPDSDLHAFTGAPRTLQLWLRYPHAQPEASLDDRWQDLDAILGGEPSTHSKSPLTPNGANWKYPAAADRGAYAISSTVTKHLLHAVEQITRSHVEAYVRRRWASRAIDDGLPPDPPPAQLAAEVEELLTYLSRLRESCTLAAAKGYGLLMALWEEKAMVE
jgi:hypothetical protein